MKNTKKPLLAALTLAILLSAAKAQTPPTIPTHACEEITGGYWSDSAGMWLGSFPYATLTLSPRAATTPYNRFRSEYGFLGYALNANIMGHWADYWDTIDTCEDELANEIRLSKEYADQILDILL